MGVPTHDLQDPDLLSKNTKTTNTTDEIFDRVGKNILMICA